MPIVHPAFPGGRFAPQEVQMWLQDMIRLDIHPEMAPQAEPHAKAAAAWLVDCVNHAYLDKRLKEASYELLCKELFTVNMDLLK